jgi:hypothetical protein
MRVLPFSTSTGTKTTLFRRVTVSKVGPILMNTSRVYSGYENPPGGWVAGVNQSTCQNNANHEWNVAAAHTVGIRSYQYVKEATVQLQAQAGGSAVWNATLTLDPTDGFANANIYWGPEEGATLYDNSNDGVLSATLWWPQRSKCATCCTRTNKRPPIWTAGIVNTTTQNMTVVTSDLNVPNTPRPGVWDMFMTLDTDFSVA